MLNRIKDRKIWARVHFIPDLKVGEFVTLRTPNVFKEMGLVSDRSWRYLSVSGRWGSSRRGLLQVIIRFLPARKMIPHAKAINLRITEK